MEEIKDDIVICEVEASPRVVKPATFNVPVAVMLATLEIFPDKKTFPWTDKSWDGEVEPIPTKPLSKTCINVEEAELTNENNCPKPVPLPQTDNLENGEVVPTPTL